MIENKKGEKMENEKTKTRIKDYLSAILSCSKNPFDISVFKDGDVAVYFPEHSDVSDSVLRALLTSPYVEELSITSLCDGMLEENYIKMNIKINKKWGGKDETKQKNIKICLSD